MFSIYNLEFLFSHFDFLENKYFAFEASILSYSLYVSFKILIFTIN